MLSVLAAGPNAFAMPAGHAERLISCCFRRCQLQHLLMGSAWQLLTRCRPTTDSLASSGAVKRHLTSTSAYSAAVSRLQSNRLLLLYAKGLPIGCNCTVEMLTKLGSQVRPLRAVKPLPDTVYVNLQVSVSIQ